MPVPRPSLVVFDLGGVLVRIPRSWAEGCRVAGLDVRSDAPDPVAWEKREPWIVAHETGRIGHAEFAAGLSKEMNGLYSPAEVERVLDAWLIEEFPAILSVLDAIDACRVPTAILSNTNEAHWRTLFPVRPLPTRFPTLRRVHHAHGSHLLRARKPDPVVFRAVERAAGTSGLGVLYFDDLERNVVGARAAGWTAHLIRPDSDPAAQMLRVLAQAGIAPPRRNFGTGKRI